VDQTKKKGWKKNMNMVGGGGKQRKKMKTKKRKRPIMPTELQTPTSQTKNMETNKTIGEWLTRKRMVKKRERSRHWNKSEKHHTRSKWEEHENK
jgi:hypothetical protein